MRNRDDPQVIEYLEQENEHLLSHNNQEDQDVIFDEIVGRIQKDDESVPYKNNGYWYYGISM